MARVSGFTQAFQGSADSPQKPTVPPGASGFLRAGWSPCYGPVQRPLCDQPGNLRAELSGGFLVLQALSDLSPKRLGADVS